MKTSIVLAILGVVIGAVSIGTFARYRSDINAAYDRLDAVETQTVELREGTVEYCLEGTGPAVLVVHGNSGGHDQALQTGRSFFGQGFRFVAVSRFGYLGSDLPADSTPAAQARVYEKVLDREGIDQAIVIGVSAGGAPSIRFALDYPERTSALVLVAADVPTPKPAEPQGPPHFLLGDFPFWLMTGPARGAMFAMFGLDRKAYRTAPEEARRGVDEVFETLLPMEPRRAGVINDEEVTNLDMSHNYAAYPLEELRAPTIVFQAKDDPLAKYEKVKRAAARIPNCDLNIFEDGGHLLFGQDEAIDRALGAFLEENGIVG